MNHIRCYVKIMIKSYQGDLPSWIEIDWEKTWDNLSYDYTELLGGHIFNNNY